MPCDYCDTRGLECGPKLPTPRKLAECGITMVPGIAVGQPGAFSGQLHVQIPVTLSGGFNLSSANSDIENPFSFASPNGTGYRPYSSAAGIASIMNPLSLGVTMQRHDFNDNIVRTWSSSESPECSSDLSYPEEIEPRDNSIRPCIPPRHPAHTLNASILPFVQSAIPHFPDPPTEPLTDEENWQLLQRLWLELDGRPSTPTGNGLAIPVRLKWNRLLHIPRCMIGRKLAGKWDKEDSEVVQSIKTAPSVLGL
jgi:hypothetical protein